MRAGELFEGVVNCKIPVIDYKPILTEMFNDGAKVEDLELLLSNFLWFLQGHVDLILKQRENDKELHEEYHKKENEKWRNAFLIQEHFQDAGLEERQKDSILQLIGYLHISIKKGNYLNSGKATMGELTMHSHKNEVPNDFFAQVQEGKISDFEWYMRIKELTDDFDKDRLELLSYKFDFYLWWEIKLWEGSFTNEELNKKIHEMIERGEKVPMRIDRKSKPSSIDAYLKKGRSRYKLKAKKEVSKEQEERVKEFVLSMEKRSRETVDNRAVMDSNNEYFGNLYKLQSLLVDLLVKYTDAERNEEYDFRSKHFEKGESLKMMPINWLKSKVLLKVLLDALIEQELIEKRDTEEIINEHFRVEKVNPTEKPKPLVWVAQIQLLPYLIEQLSQERFIEVKGAKHKLTALHFINGKGEKLNPDSLGSLLSTLNKEVRNDGYIVREITNVMKTLSNS